MRALAGWHSRNIAVEQSNRPGIGREFPGDQIEQRGLTCAVWADDQATFALLDVEIHIAGHAQPAEGFGEPVYDQSAHCRGPAVIGKLALLLPRQSERVSRTAPGTRPSGMNTTIATKMAPSMKFQRST